MSKNLKSELKLLEIQQSIDEQKINYARCEESDRMRRKADQTLLCRRMHLESEEEQMYMDILNAKEAQARQDAELEQEQKLAQAMADLKHKEIVEIKTKELLRNNSHELRCVERQLRTAYGKKELISQIKEKEAMKKEEKVREYYNDLKIIEADNCAKRAEVELQTRKKELKLEYKKAISEQLQNIADKRQEKSPPCPPIEFGHPIKDNSKTNCFKIDIDKFKQINSQLKDKERELSDKTDKCIKDYMMDIERRTKQQEEIKKKKEKEKEKCYQYLADNIISLTLDTSGNNEIRMNMVQNQQQNAIWLAEEKEKKLKIQRREKMLEQFKTQLKMKKDKANEEKEKDLANVKELLQNFQDFNTAEERKNNEKKRIMKEYGNELKKMIDHKTNMKNKQRTIMKNEYTEAVKLEAQRLALIDEEQKMIIKQHIKNLEGVWPICSKKCENSKT